MYDELFMIASLILIWIISHSLSFVVYFDDVQYNSLSFTFGIYESMFHYVVVCLIYFISYSTKVKILSNQHIQYQLGIQQPKMHYPMSLRFIFLNHIYTLIWDFRIREWRIIYWLRNQLLKHYLLVIYYMLLIIEQRFVQYILQSKFWQ